MNVSLDRRRALRRNSTDAETALWSELRDRHLGGFKFRRQHQCGPFILDFYCHQVALAIELDGGQHDDESAAAYDEARTAFLRARGIDVLRIPNDVVFTERLAVLEAIAAALGIGSPLPSP
jgi:very-short-patch-repair endonuclease